MEVFVMDLKCIIIINKGAIQVQKKITLQFYDICMLERYE